jgi:hypothetical protein
MTFVYDLVRDRPLLRPLALLVAIGLGVVGVVAIRADVRADRERALNEWQIRLGLLADERAGAVRGWLEGQFA